MGDRYFDLGNFAVNNELDERRRGGAAGRLLRRAADRAPGCATLGLMRFMSDFREAMWGVVQSAVSELDFDFDGYAREHFDRLARDGRRPALRRWLEEAREPAG